MMGRTDLAPEADDFVLVRGDEGVDDLLGYLWRGLAGGGVVEEGVRTAGASGDGDLDHDVGYWSVLEFGEEMI